MEALQLTPERTETKYVLSSTQNRALSTWQREHLRLSWAEHARPWEIEGDVVAALSPPLNLAGNSSHPFHQKLSDARARFRDAAHPTA